MSGTLTDNGTAPPAGSGSQAVLAQSEFTRRVIVIGATVTVCLSILGAVAAMVYRTLLDGNTPLTNDITTKLSIIAVGGIMALTAALFGSNNTLAKLIDKVLP